MIVALPNNYCILNIYCNILNLDIPLFLSMPKYRFHNIEKNLCNFLHKISENVPIPLEWGKIFSRT